MSERRRLEYPLSIKPIALRIHLPFPADKIISKRAPRRQHLRAILLPLRPRQSSNANIRSVSIEREGAGGGERETNANAPERIAPLLPAGCTCCFFLPGVFARASRTRGPGLRRVRAPTDLLLPPASSRGGAPAAHSKNSRAEDGDVRATAASARCSGVREEVRVG